MTSRAEARVHLGTGNPALPRARRWRSRGIAAATAALTVAAILVVPAPAFATFPNRNGLIAFAADAGSGSQIYTVHPNGQGLRQITHLDGDAFNPDWAPDGRTIVFDLNTSIGASVELMNLDGSHLRDLTPRTECCSDDPSFTPNGKRIVFEHFNPDTGDDAVWSMKLNGTEQRRIVGLPTGATDPNVSPNGKTLTFRSWDGLPGDNGALFRYNLGSESLRQLTPFMFVSIKHDWEPSGRRVLFSYHADTGNPNISTNIATIDPNGTHLRRLTHFHGGAVSAFAGSYSPDGGWIVLRLEDNGSYALYKMRPDGSHLTLVIDLGSLKPRLTDWGPRAQEDGGN